MSTGPLIRKSTHDLALQIATNLHAAGLSEEVENYYLGNKSETIPAICRGFIIPGQEIEPVKKTLSRQVKQIVQPALFKTTDTDLGMWLTKAEEFAKQCLGVEVKLREMFAIPDELPWQSVIPVFDPGNITNRDMVELLKRIGFKKPYEETDVIRYTDSASLGKPTLHLIENSIKPNADTMDLSPNELRNTGKSFLRLRGYGLAMGLYHFVTNEYLDPQTFTWFPEDRLPGGRVAGGYWDPGYGEVGFGWRSPDFRFSSSGARVAISVPLKT